MTEPQFYLACLAAVVGVGVGLYAIHRLLLWLEARGWVYYRNVAPKGGGVRNAALEFERMIGPSVEHRIEAEEARVERAENDGA